MSLYVHIYKHYGIIVTVTDGQLTSPDEPVCVGEQVVFTCQHNATGSQTLITARWTVTLPNITLRITSSSAQLVGTESSFVGDPGYGFEILIVPSNSPRSLTSELSVTATRQLNGAPVECAGNSGRYMTTI